MKVLKYVVIYAIVLCLSVGSFSFALANEQAAEFPDSVLTAPNAVEVSEMSYGAGGTNVGGVTVKNVKAVLLDGLPYKGSDTQIFAYWGMPDNIAPGEKVPGVVLVHGGGGTAFADWVQRWNDKGYAAIAIYWGETSDKDPAVPAKYNWTVGPRINGGFNDVTTEKREDQWMYHSVSKAMLANSFLRAQEGVDPDKVGICGVSWGGVITSYTIGVDNRFAFAAPIFGAGYISESKGQMGSICNTPEKAFWDAKNVLPNATTPTLFVNGDSDPWFSLNLQASSYTAADSSKLCIVNGLLHGHATAFAVDTVYDFADSIVKSAPALAKFTTNTVENDDNFYYAKATYAASTPLTQATLYYTKHGLEYGAGNTFMYPWEYESIELSDGNELKALLPSGTKGYYIATTDALGRISCTPYVEFENPLVTGATFSNTVEVSDNLDTYSTLTTSTKNVLLLTDAWTPYVNIKNSEDTEHGKVIYATNKNLANVTNLRWGVKCGNECIDINKGKATIEFDMKVSDYNFGQLVIMPFSKVPGLSDPEQTRSDISGGKDNSGRYNQLCTLSVATKSQMDSASGPSCKDIPGVNIYQSGNTWMQMRAWDNLLVLAQPWGGINGNYKISTYPADGWHNVKITIDNTRSVPVIDFYVDGQFGGRNINSTFGENAGRELMGVKFSLKVNNGTATNYTDSFVQLDNFKFSGYSCNTCAYMAKTVDSDGSEYDISAPAKTDTEKILVYYDGTIDATNAEVSLTEGTKSVKSSISCDETNKIAVISVDEILQKNKKYRLKISGMATSSGSGKTNDVDIVFVTGNTGKLTLEKANIGYKGTGVQSIIENDLGTIQFGWKLNCLGDAPESIGAYMINWGNFSENPPDGSQPVLTKVEYPDIKDGDIFYSQIENISPENCDTTITACPIINDTVFTDYAISGKVNDTIIYKPAK